MPTEWEKEWEEHLVFHALRSVHRAGQCYGHGESFCLEQDLIYQDGPRFKLTKAGVEEFVALSLKLKP